jgi:hypothetical protein
MSRAAQRRGLALFGSQNMQSIAPNYNVSVRAEAGNRDRPDSLSCLGKKEKGEAAVAPIRSGKKGLLWVKIYNLVLRGGRSRL